MELYLLLGIVFIEFLIIIWLLMVKRKAFVHKPKSKNTPDSVGKYYDSTTDKFLEVYGEIIQAFRTKNVEEYLDYTIKSAQIGNGMKVLDAGCGVGGPAVYFAQKMDRLQIDACTISNVQVEKAKSKVEEKGVGGRVRVALGDYHKVDQLFETGKYDRVYFLESFGHSNDKTKLVNAVWEVLKPGGMIYIKDLFRRETEDEWEQLYINRICEQINEAYHYQIADLNPVLDAIRRKGYILHFVKIPEVERGAFENLTISNDFQNLFDIGKIESWEDYVFPIDFFEILAEKPKYTPEEEMHLYFLNRKK
ncbi:MAG: methyltransferase domain-containing protein [Chitinophagales bacterium]